MHQCERETDALIHSDFILHKKQASILHSSFHKKFHLIYFDAFAPLVQTELWSQQVFEKLLSMLYCKGTLVTYCSKGTVRRAMEAAGFETKKIPGPRGKKRDCKSKERI